MQSLRIHFSTRAPNKFGFICCFRKSLCVLCESTFEGHNRVEPNLWALSTYWAFRSGTDAISHMHRNKNHTNRIAHKQGEHIDKRRPVKTQWTQSTTSPLQSSSTCNPYSFLCVQSRQCVIAQKSSRKQMKTAKQSPLCCHFQFYSWQFSIISVLLHIATASCV